MLPGVYEAKRKNNTTYYRTSITFRGKHISLGSFDTEEEAHKAYVAAGEILSKKTVTLLNYQKHLKTLSPEKAIVLLNYRDNGIYIKTPIYLQTGYFSYYLNGTEEFKFDNDDLFYYSSHPILCHDGHYYVNDYGMQYGILSRFGIHPFAVSGIDYQFANGDERDFRYQNVVVINRYQGVRKITYHDMIRYETRIHINGHFLIGRFRTEEKAAVAYNKAADLAIEAGITKNFIQNYVVEYTPREYAEVYHDLSMPEKFLDYLRDFEAATKND